MKPLDVPFARVPLAAEVNRIWEGQVRLRELRQAVGQPLTGF